jgi:hypothetical protein
LIASTALDRLHHVGDVASAGHHDDRRRIALGIEPEQDVEAGAARHVQIEQDAGRHPGARLGEDRRAVGEQRDAKTGCDQQGGERVARSGIVVDDEDLGCGSVRGRHDRRLRALASRAVRTSR